MFAHQGNSYTRCRRQGVTRCFSNGVIGGTPKAAMITNVYQKPVLANLIHELSLMVVLYTLYGSLSSSFLPLRYVEPGRRPGERGDL